MYKVGDYVVYKKDVVLIKEIKEKYYNDIDYFCLIPVLDESLKIVVPVTSNDIRNLMTKKDIETLIKKVDDIKPIDVEDRLLEQEYKKLINSSNHENLIKIIKTTYLRNKERLDNNKKIGDKDNMYFNQAEKYLYSEIAIVLNMTLDDAKEYVINKINSKKI